MSALALPSALAAFGGPAAATDSNQTVFLSTGSPQSWTVPSGVTSAYVTLIGGAGGADEIQDANGGAAAQVQGTLTWASGTDVVVAWVGGAGLDGNGATPGAGGWNGGAAGGTGSWSPGSSLPGGGGGGATDLRIGGFLPDSRVMVAGGGGGGGGAHQGGSGQGYIAGGAGGAGGTGAFTAGVAAAGDGATAGGDNPGSGGAGGVDPSGSGQLGGAAETGTGNAGGGGGGGGWLGGGGGQPGQAGILGFAGAGGGGGGGSSYASPTLVTNANATVAAAGAAPSATIQWVDIATRTLPSLQAGVPVDQQLSATFPIAGTSITWQVASGSLPTGLTLSGAGQLSGMPTRAQRYSFTLTATAGPGALATSEVSFSGEVTSNSAPSAPTITSATGGTETATVTWSAPGYIGTSALKEYLIGYSTDAGQSWTLWAAVSAPTTTYTGSLPGGKTYVFQVSATNQTTTGPPSANSAPVVVSVPATPPGAPTDVTGTAGFETVALSWTAPSQDGGSAVTGYRVRYSSDSGVNWSVPVTTGTTATTYSYSSLTDPDLLFEVAAVNINGQGAWSAPSAPVTPETDPTAPVLLRGTPGDAQVALTWSAPGSLGGGALLGYRVQALGGGYVTWTTLATTSGAGTTFTASSLTNGVEYRFRVAAITNLATSPYSKDSTPVRPFTVPGPPTAVVATAGDASASLSWSAPASNGGRAITGYRVESSSGLTWSVAIAGTGSTATTALVTGLANGSGYQFRVSAISSAGVGTQSAPSPTVVPSGGGGGGGNPTPPPTPTPTPTPSPVASSTTTTAPPPSAAPTPTSVLPGVISVPPGTYIPVRPLPVRVAPGRTLADAPSVTARRDAAFALRVRDLPPARTAQVFIADGDRTPVRWVRLGTVVVDADGRATLPAVLSTRLGSLTVRLTIGKLDRYVEVLVRP